MRYSSHRYSLAELVRQHDPFHHADTLPAWCVLAHLPVSVLECGAAVLAPL